MSDVSSVRKAAKASREADLQRLEIIRGLMSLPPGRSWVYRWLERCHMFRTTFTGSSLSMAFQEGERNIGLELLQDVMAATPDQFIAMIREANSNEWSTRKGLNGNDRGSVDESADGYGPYADSGYDGDSPFDTDRDAEA